MNVMLDLTYIKLLKREFAKLAPATASSHLTEAIAAGFGFNTNAALRAALKQGPIQAELDDNAGWQRLVDIGADPCPPKGTLSLAAMRLLAWTVEWSDHRIMRAPDSTQPPARLQRAECPNETEAIDLALSLIAQDKFYVTVRRGRETVYELAELQAISYRRRKSAKSAESESDPRNSPAK
jgi:hypothetical protein